MFSSVLDNPPFGKNICSMEIEEDADFNLSGIYLPPPPEFEDQINQSQCNQNANCNGTTLTHDR